MNCLGRPIASNNDLLIRIIERVERMKKFLFGRLFACDKLDIVYEQNIDAAVLCTKLFRFLEANSVDNLIGKFF